MLHSMLYVWLWAKQLAKGFFQVCFIYCVKDTSNAIELC